jgi:hypothetical protein
MAELYDADVIFVATHSQGSIVSTHLLDRLIRDKHIRPPRSEPSFSIDPSSMDTVNVSPTGKPQRICCLAQCMCTNHGIQTFKIISMFQVVSISAHSDISTLVL